MTAHHRTAEWARFVRMARPIIKASLPAPCINRCKKGGIVYPEQRFDVAHIIDVAHGGTDDLQNAGPAHPGCNRSDGGRAGARKTNAMRKAKTQRQEYPQW